MRKIRAGTRGSLLALAQTRIVAQALKEKFPGLQIETITIKTTGDKIQDVPLSRIGTKSLFTKEIEEALLENRIDIAVHSLKDLPAEIPGPLMIGAVTEREPAGDVLISREGRTLESLPKNANVG